jgi:hypothetical protein
MVVTLRGTEPGLQADWHFVFGGRMRSEALKAIAGPMKQRVEKHWDMCLEHPGLAHHSVEAHAAVDQCVADYFEELAQLPEVPTQAQILDVVRALFARLDEVTERFGGGLLETDERELLVTPINEAAAVAGLNVASFPEGDPTLMFRNF